MLYVDTSVLVCALTNEDRTEAVQDWLADQSPGELVISDWVTTEFSAALSVKARVQQLSPVQRAEVVATFSELVDASFVELPVSRTDLRTAARYADQHETGLRAGDALHLAVAANHGARIRSLDRAMVAAAGSLGISAGLI